MPEQSQPGRLKADSPATRVSLPAPDGKPVSWPLQAIGVGVFLVLAGLATVHWLLRGGPSMTPRTTPVPKVEVPLPVPDPKASLPHASESEPVIGDVADLAKPWSSKQFLYANSRTGENVAALLLRLPGSASSAYWAFAIKAPAGGCNLEYITDRKKLNSDYGFRGARHPMVGNPCTRTVFDPLKLMNLPGNVWARGAIVQGSDLRPPLAIEVEIVGREVHVLRME